MTLYGIPNCTSVKKARAWLAAHQHDVAFHDFKKHGVDPTWLACVAAQTGWQALLNTRGTTSGALALMQAQSSLIKRPVLEIGGTYHLGFSELQYQDLLG
ncbi:MAG: arsenate reductase [Hydrogenophilales bacterium 12-61-10]|nr:MAG: arsenate reductase [Hydrogenophilales bacterium 12-61-10]